jgi:hypothetical protein
MPTGPSVIPTTGSSVVPTIRQLFEYIADKKLSRTLLAGLSYLVDQLNISVPLKLSTSLVPVLETLDYTGKITADTLKVPILEYLYITVIQLFIMYNYDITNEVSKDHNLTTEQFVKQFSAGIDTYTDICCITYCNYIKENANKGLTNNLNKEFATRVLVEHMFLTLILQPAFNPQVISLPPSLCGALFLIGIDFVQDKVNSNAVPYLKYEEIVPFYFKYFDSHFKPLIINYFEKNSKSLLGMELPVTPLNLPPTNDPLLVAVLNGSSTAPSPSEIFSGVYMIPVWNQFIGGLELTPDYVIVKP